MILRGVLRRGLYVDSIAGMRLAEALGRLPGVASAAVLMATEANRAALLDSGLWPSEVEDDARATDLVIAVRADGDEAARTALVRAQELLAETGGAQPTTAVDRPRSVLSAARAARDANLAVISVPGPYAALEAHQALSAGLHVFLFSDGVTPADEIALKRRARERGVLVMGPECGTSLIDGIGLGFANHVRRGAIGVVGASGTGLQEVTSLIHRLGGGVSQAIGTGGRDLSEQVGGLTTLQAIDWLAGDAGTRVIVLVSKPASAVVADAVLAAATGSGKPVVACLLGFEGATPSGVRAVETLEAAAIAAVAAGDGTPASLGRPRVRRRARGHVAGLFTGGTLCAEARAIVGEAGARFVDLGAPEYTRGRPHPIIAPDLRSEAIIAAGDDAGVSVVLLDVVLGECAHPDPATAAARAIEEARARAARAGRTLEVVAHVVGTDEDPQRLSAQEKTLRAVGVIVCASNRIAAEVARGIAG